MNAEPQRVPIFGVRSFAKRVLVELEATRRELETARSQLKELGALPVIDLINKTEQKQQELAAAEALLVEAHRELATAKTQIVATEDLAILQEAGIYTYSHPLSDAVAYQARLDNIREEIKAMNRKDGGAIHAVTAWTVNGSNAEGRRMVRDFSKLMLRAFNAEADNLVRQLKPYKVIPAIERLKKVATTIEKLGATMQIRVTIRYMSLRVQELQLVADFLQKKGEEKDREREEKMRLREERKAQQEMERERLRLEKERQHYLNALSLLDANGDIEGATRLRAKLEDVDKAIADVDYRAANIRAGYVYVISNIGSFGDSLIKVGMTRRLEPMDRVRELSDASVPFNYDVHAIFFSDDAIGIESAMHQRLSKSRLNLVNQRREFFRATALEAKQHLAELAGELLTFYDVPEALEYRQSVAIRDGHAKSVASA